MTAPTHATLAAELATTDSDDFPLATIEQIIDWIEGGASPKEVCAFFRQFVTTCDDHIVRLGWLEAIAAQRNGGKKRKRPAPSYPITGGQGTEDIPEATPQQAA